MLCRQCGVKDAEETGIPLSSVYQRMMLCNLQFADDIALLGDSEEKVHQLTERLEKTAAG